MGADQVIEPITNTILQWGPAGAIILLQSMVIGYLFKGWMNERQLRIDDIKEMGEKGEATITEQSRVIASNTATMESMKMALNQAPIRERR